jgi:high affinity Mn2+ porin
VVPLTPAYPLNLLQIPVRPGQTEIIGWTDCDESLSIGAVLKGALWGRLDDKVGVGGGVVEGLSPEARAYFAAGGLGILIGDGQLNYRPEKILEAYYAYSLNKWATLTLDYQFEIRSGGDHRRPVATFAGIVDGRQAIGTMNWTLNRKCRT